MGIAVNRFTQRANVIIWTFDRQFSLDDYRSALTESRRIAAEITTSFDLIADLSTCEKLATDSFFELEKTAATLSNNLRSVAIVGSNIMIRTIISAFRQSDSRLGDKIYFAETLDQARKLVCPNLKRATGAFSTQEFRPISLSS